MYKNQNELDRIQAELQEVMPGQKICSLSVIDDCAIGAEIRIPVKGNAPQIKRLEQLGWRKTRRHKVTNIPNWERCQYEGFSFVQIMRKRIMY